jgi:hypothetical protein
MVDVPQDTGVEQEQVSQIERPGENTSGEAPLDTSDVVNLGLFLGGVQLHGELSNYVESLERKAARTPGNSDDFAISSTKLAVGFVLASATSSALEPRGDVLSPQAGNVGVATVASPPDLSKYLPLDLFKPGVLSLFGKDTESYVRDSLDPKDRLVLIGQQRAAAEIEGDTGALEEVPEEILSELGDFLISSVQGIDHDEVLEILADETVARGLALALRDAEANLTERVQQEQAQEQRLAAEQELPDSRSTAELVAPAVR